MSRRPPTKTSRRVPTKTDTGEETTISDQCLGDLEAIKIVTENGKELAFSVADETAVPVGGRELLEAARTCPSRVAFWSYQTERALGKLRHAEKELDEAVAESALIARKYFREETDEQYIGKDQVQAFTDLDKKVKQAKTRLHRAKRDYGMLRALRDASEHRSFVIRKLMGTGFEEA